MQVTRLILLPVAAAAMMGCSTPKQVINEESEAAKADILARRSALKDSIVEAERQRVARQVVGKPYLAGNSTPLARDVAMPEVLRQRVPVTSLVNRGSVDLQTALSILSEQTGISITATTDALMPASAFAPKLGGSQAGNTVQAPSRVTLIAEAKPLWNILDDVARQASVSWRPINGGAEFYRVETKVFTLSAIPQTTSSSASLGRNGGSNTVFDSQSKSSFESKDQNPMKGLKASVDALLSQSGVATMSMENQTLVVTDAKDAIERVDSYIKDQNKAFSRRVRVLIEAIEVVDKNASEFGIDWTLLQKTATDALTIAPLASLTGTQGATLTYAQADGLNAGSGSMAVIKALNEVGTVVNRRSFPLLTTSGRPVTQALRNTFNYVDQIQTASIASSATTTSAPTVTQKEETVGTFLTIVPTAKTDGTVFLSVSFDVTSLASLTPFTMGSGTTSVTVQQKSVDGNGVIQEVPVRSGQTVVIGGIENHALQNTERRLGAGVPLLAGGSDANKITRTRTILLVTAVTEEGV